MGRYRLGNPVGAAIDAFTSLTQSMEGMEDRKQQRELRKQQIETHEFNMGEARKQSTREDTKWGEHVKLMGDKEEFENSFSAMVDAHYNGEIEKLTKNQLGGLMYMLQQSPSTPDNMSLQDMHSHHANLSNLMNTGTQLFQQIAKSGKTKVTIDANGAAKPFFDSLMSVYGKDINIGKDKFGESVETGTIKSIENAHMDFENKPPMMVVNLRVKSPVKADQVFEHRVQEGMNEPFTVNPNATGLIEVGNTDLLKRKIRGNADGSISTLDAIVAPKTVDGVTAYYAVETIDKNGRKLSREQAEKFLDQKIPQHLGKFDSEENALKYINELQGHSMWGQDNREYAVAPGTKYREYVAPMTMGHRSENDDQIQTIPIPLLMNQSANVLRLEANMLKGLAKIDRKEADSLWKEKQDKLAKNKEAARMNEVGASAITSLRAKLVANPKMSVHDQRLYLQEKLMAGNVDAKTAIDLAKSVIEDKVDKLPDKIKTFRELQKMSPTERAEYRQVMQEQTADTTKVHISTGGDKEKYEIKEMQDESGKTNLYRIPKSGGKAEKVEVEGGGSIAKPKTAKDQKSSEEANDTRRMERQRSIRSTLKEADIPKGEVSKYMEKVRVVTHKLEKSKDFQLPDGSPDHNKIDDYIKSKIAKELATKGKK